MQGGGGKRCANAFQGDKEIIMLAVWNDGEALEYADAELKHDKEVVHHSCDEA